MALDNTISTILATIAKIFEILVKLEARVEDLEEEIQKLRRKE